MTTGLQRRLDRLEARSSGGDFDIAAALGAGSDDAMRWERLPLAEKLRDERQRLVELEEMFAQSRGGMREAMQMLLNGTRRSVADMEQELAASGTTSRPSIGDDPQASK